MVGFQVRCVRHHSQRAVFHAPAHADLFADAFQNLRQGLVDGVERDFTRDAWVDVDIDSGIAGERKKQAVHIQLANHHAVGFRSWPGFGFGEAGQGDYRLGNGARHAGAEIRVAIRFLRHSGRAATGREYQNDYERGQVLGAHAVPVWRETRKQEGCCATHLVSAKGEAEHIEIFTALNLRIYFAIHSHFLCLQKFTRALSF